MYIFLYGCQGRGTAVVSDFFENPMGSEEQ
jgi:hypothetical protein